MTPDFWNRKRVFVTGHTGFKGSWLSLWLQSQGAEVHGYALLPPTHPNMFTIANAAKDMASSRIADIRDFAKLSAALRDCRPEIVFHLAAQPLVRHSYQQPVETFDINVMGLVHLLEAVRAIEGIKAVVNVTSDKCYGHHASPAAHTEGDNLGGHDPYSSSKSCAELVTAAYRSSYLATDGVAIATARAGNVIGGGDWAEDRLLPDFFRALESGSTLRIRSPAAIRPWQHVLEPLSGYLTLAERLYTNGAAFAEPWNFGPDDKAIQTVGWIVEYLASRSTDLDRQIDNSPQPHETSSLRLNSSKAAARLGWSPRWQLQVALDRTLSWYAAMRNGLEMREVTLAQIAEFALPERDAVANVGAGNAAL